MMQAHEILFTYVGKFRKLPYKGMIFVFVISFILAVVNSLFLYRLVSPELAAEGERVKSVSVVIPKELPTLQSPTVKAIVSRNIFNKTGEIPKDDMKDDKAYKSDEPVRSELPLKLNGIIYGGSPQSGLALIENLETKKQNSFLVGDSVTREAVLIEVLESKVILQVFDHKEFLELNDKLIERSKWSRKSGAVAGLGQVTSGDKYTEEGFERDGTKITMSADYRQKLLTADFAKVLQDAKAEPVYEGGELNGFRLTRIRGDSVYEKGGLMNEDIVKEINGVSLVDTAQAIKLLNSLRGANQIDIGVYRGGKKLNLSIQVK